MPATFEVRKDIKEKWLAALRSGKYKQGSALLRRNGDSYCCIGVLCRVIGTAKDDQYAAGLPSADMLVDTNGRAVRPATGIVHESPSRIMFWRLGDDMHKLTDLNDVRQLTFPELATIIEQHVSTFD